jgi:ABC-type multidrug transport system ATPase subunit
MSGRKKYDSGGRISLNGQELTRGDLQNLSCVYGYFDAEFELIVAALDLTTLRSFVEQEDAILGTLTARETLSYALRLTMPKAPKGFIKERVDHVIEILGLQGCADIQIGTPLKRGLSGGQKRRVSIGCSLVTYP